MSGFGRVDMQPAFILHARAYRESSQILEVFCRDHGRIGLVAKGARRPRSRWAGLLRAFMPLNLSWSGRGGLFTLRNAEPSGASSEVSGSQLMSGFYLNELILKLLERGDGHPELFAWYAQALSELAENRDTEPVLRRFEVNLLNEVGYGLNLTHDAVSHQPLVPDQNYQYVIEQGAVPAESGEFGEAGNFVFSGADILAIGTGIYASGQQLRSAKRLLRAVLNHHLGGRPLKTRQVLASMRRCV